MYRGGELRQKEVINLSNAERLGFVSDVEVSLDKAAIEAIVVPGKTKIFTFGARDEYVIPWEKVKKIGEDVILVEI
jgi:YlmC/YmxH family sporulation protein